MLAPRLTAASSPAASASKESTAAVHYKKSEARKRDDSLMGLISRSGNAEAKKRHLAEQRANNLAAMAKVAAAIQN